jgi:hypothetical protein
LSLEGEVRELSVVVSISQRDYKQFHSLAYLELLGRSRPRSRGCRDECSRVFVSAVHTTLEISWQLESDASSWLRDVQYGMVDPCAAVVIVGTQRSRTWSSIYIQASSKWVERSYRSAIEIAKEYTRRANFHRARAASRHVEPIPGAQGGR